MIFFLEWLVVGLFSLIFLSHLAMPNLLYFCIVRTYSDYTCSVCEGGLVHGHAAHGSTPEHHLIILDVIICIVHQIFSSILFTSVFTVTGQASN
jgi:hypothetical protein